MDVSFRIDYSSLLSSVCLPVVSLCVNCCLLQKEASLMRVERSTNLFV